MSKNTSEGVYLSLRIPQPRSLPAAGSRRQEQTRCARSCCEQPWQPDERRHKPFGRGIATVLLLVLGTQALPRPRALRQAMALGSQLVLCAGFFARGFLGKGKRPAWGSGVPVSSLALHSVTCSSTAAPAPGLARLLLQSPVSQRFQPGSSGDVCATAANSP